MPLPTPNKNEDEKKFIGRCISTLTKSKEFDSQEQRIAVCYSQWENKNKKESAIVEIKEDVKIGDIILEKGDKIIVLESKITLNL